MNQQREQMEKALKEQFVPELRERGFQGSLPHFRRIRSDRIDYLTVQFHSAGGSFVVEIARSGPDGVTKGFGSEVPVKKLNVQYFMDRLRLGSDLGGGKADHWFEFGHRSYSLLKPPRQNQHYVDIARSVVPFLDSQAEHWWSSD